MSQTEGEARHLETLDRDLGRLSSLETATVYITRPLVAPTIALIFIVLAGLFAAIFFGQTSHSMVVVVAAVFGAYMALNIGANDVANNMGPAVGANALTMGGAIAIAVVFETAGALIAGGDVVKTIAKGIVAPEALADGQTFIWAMLAALLAGALWVNLATWLGAPVSTTHAIVGGVVGSGVAAAGLDAVNWPTMGGIAASWVVSPLLGGLVAAGFLWFIEARIIHRRDKIAAARTWVPVLVGLMAGTFASYLALKGLSQLIKVTFGSALLIGAAIGTGIWLTMIPVVRRQSVGLENRNKSLKVLFAIPLVVSAALLSFAHGANDVANAVGPLAAIVQATATGDFTAAVRIPFWVMAIGAFGISFGLALFGPKLIRMVGNEITRLNPMRAYCVALSAALTVIVASWLGLPVSSTHIAVGAIFGVGFFREWDTHRRLVAARAAIPDLGTTPDERSRRKLVRRTHVMTIVTAWIVTVPASALLSAVIFFAIRAVAG